MAIRFTSASSEHIAIASSALNYNADYTWMAWIYLITDTNNFIHFLGLHDSGDDHADDLGTTSNGTTLSLYINGGGTGSTTNGSNLSTATWYHVAIVRSGNSVTVYLNGVANIGPVTHNPSGRNAISRMRVGTWNGSSEFFNGRWGYSKAWSAALSAAEVWQEMYLVRPSRATNLYGWWPTLSGATEQLADYGGNAHSWSQTNTPTDEDPPPVSWGGAAWGFPETAAPAAGLSFFMQADLLSGGMQTFGGGFQ